MKKYIVILFLMFLLCGCGKDQYKTCEIDVTNNSDNYSMHATYKIYYSGSYVKKIEQDIKYKSDDEEVLKYFYESETLNNSNNNDLYGGFSLVTTLSETEVNVVGEIDFKKSNIKKMLARGYFTDENIVSNKLTLNGAKYYYEAKGAKCGI